jgi:putative ABC transport system permease protein
MYLLELFKTALQQLRANRMRSILTTLGIVIGIGTVILIVSVLEGFRGAIEADLNILGANTFQVQRYDPNEGFSGHGRREQRKILKKELADAIRERAPSVKFVGAENWAFGQAITYKGERTNPNVQVAGGTPEFTINNGYFIAQGRFLNERDVRTHTRVVILGMDVVDKLFPNEDPLDKVVKIRGKKFTVVGIYEAQGASTFGENRDNHVTIPLTTWEDMYGKNDSVNLTIMAESADVFYQAQEEVIGILRKERKVPPGKDNDFAIFSNETLIDSFNNIAVKIQWGGIALGIISLLVGGIGVMNIMLVSVTERTREIGIRKATGARKRDILKQFLLEAVALCLLGGTLGFGVGIGLAGLIALLASLPMSVPLWSVFAALITTSVIGIFSGLYPAYKAANQNVIDALRYE